MSKQFYTNDPTEDYERYDASRSRKPICPVCCGNSSPIYILPDGRRICEDCIKESQDYADDELPVCISCGRVLDQDEKFYKLFGQVLCRDCTHEFILKEENND